VTLNETQVKIWNAISTNTDRNYSDAFRLLLGLVKDSEKGKAILKIGGLEIDT
jgi:hypothetical protein